MFVWNLNFSTLVAPEDEKYPWSVLNEDWNPRPAYTALQEMPKQ
jgi:polysaccharide biosynthesis protein PslG